MTIFKKALSAITLCVACCFSASYAQADNASPTSSPAGESKNLPAVTAAQENVGITNAHKQLILPARTPIRLTLTNPVGSKTAIPGEQFPLTVSEDIKIEGTIVIPQGTPAIGEVIHAQKAKGFGKAGELLLTIRYIDLNGMKIKMRAFQPLQGNNKSSTAMAVSSIPYVGVFAGFVQGDDIQMPALTQVQALTALENIMTHDENPISTKTALPMTSNTNTTTGESK
jgi:hypothetical protein